jgi:hypothetical protein
VALLELWLTPDMAAAAVVRLGMTRPGGWLSARRAPGASRGARYG